MVVKKGELTMKAADPQVLAFLSTVLANELTAVNQYFLHARMLDNWGVTKLGKHEYTESIEEMRHADVLIQRILLLEGVPNVQHLDHIKIGHSPEEIVQSDLALEQKAAVDLRQAIPHCENVRDYVSRDLFATILRDEEQHIDFLETQLDLIGRIGVQNWVKLNSDPAG
jgi:bacterioferritin